MAWAQQPIGQKVFFNLFGDCSMPGNRSGISVTYQPLARLHPKWDITCLAWPVNPMYEHYLGQFLAVSECLAIAPHEIAEFCHLPEVRGKTIVVRIFNDNQYNLQYLKGSKEPEEGFRVLAKPLLDFISMQSWALFELGLDVELELHWIPGHHHHITPHQWADELSREAQRKGRSFSTKTGDNWDRSDEPCVARYLKRDLFRAAYEALEFRPDLEISSRRAAERRTRQRLGGNKPDLARPAPRPRVQDFIGRALKAAIVGENLAATKKLRQGLAQPASRPDAKPPSLAALPTSDESPCIELRGGKWERYNGEAEARAATLVKDSSGSNQASTWDANNPNNSKQSRASNPPRKTTTTLRGEPRDRDHCKNKGSKATTDRSSGV